MNSRQHYINLLKTIHKNMQENVVYESSGIKKLFENYPITKWEITQALKYQPHFGKIKRQKLGQKWIYWK